MKKTKATLNYPEIIKELEILCKSTGHFIREHFEKLKQEDIQTKEKNSLVSFVDQQAEIKITGALKKLIPEASFLTEEATVLQKNESLQWVVDPLDGTTNYIVGIPHFSISIALRKDDVVLVGVVFDVMRKDFYHAVKGGGSFRNHQSIRVSKPKVLEDCAIATGFPYNKNLIGDKNIEVLSYFLKNARIMRRLGSAALDLCFVAKGSFEIYYEKYLNAWDIAAGSLIVSEAGGRVTDMNGKSSYITKGEIIAYSEGLNEEVRKIINFFKS